MAEKGCLTTEYTAWCKTGTCVCWHRVYTTTRTEARRELRRAGWRYTRKHGYQCPGCFAGLPERNDFEYHRKHADCGST